MPLNNESRHVCGSMARPNRLPRPTSPSSEFENRERISLHRGRSRDPSEAGGWVMTVTFELDGRSFAALNGGPVFKFNEAISLQVIARTRRRSTTTGTR